MNSDDFEESGAYSGALPADPDLALVVDAWPGLSVEAKRIVLGIIKG